MAGPICSCCSTIYLGRTSHVVLLLLVAGAHCTLLYFFGIESSLSWTPGLEAYAQMMDQVPSTLPVLIWLIKLSYVFAALFVCLIVITFLAIAFKSGRLVRLMAALLFVLVTTHQAFGFATAMFYAEVLRPKMESKEVVMKAAVEYPNSFYSVKSYSKASKSSKTISTAYYSYNLVYVSNTSWFLRFYCGELDSTPADLGSKSLPLELRKIEFQPSHISNCTDESFLDAMARFFYVYSIPFSTPSGIVLVILVQQQILFYVRPSQRVCCEHWESCSPLCLKIWCICFTIIFKLPTSEEQTRTHEVNQPIAAQETERLNVEQAAVSTV